MFCSNFLSVEPTRSPDRTMRLLRKWCRSIRRCFRCTGTPAERRWRCSAVLSIRTAAPASGSPPNGNGCANRRGVSHSSDDHEQVQTARIDYNIGPERHHLVSFSGGHRAASRLHRPNQSLIQCHFAAAAVLVRGGIHARVLAEPGELLQSGVLLVREPVRAKRLSADARGFPDRAPRQRCQRTVHHHRRTRQHLGPRQARIAVFHQRQSRLEPRRSRAEVWHEHPNLSPE